MITEKEKETYDTKKKGKTTSKKTTGDGTKSCCTAANGGLLKLGSGQGLCYEGYVLHRLKGDGKEEQTLMPRIPSFS